ncbi:MAG: integrase arm-type DNA-binding domain-containing protein [Paracoccaceae bacterium]
MTALEVKRLEHPGRGRNVNIAVGGIDGLAMQITPTGAKSWILRCKVGDRRRHIGLGGYPEVSLAIAREYAREARALVRQGVDPVEDRRAKRAHLISQQRRGLTFRMAVDRYLDAKLSEFNNPKHQKQWRSTLETYANPELGALLVSGIDVMDIQRVLVPIWESKTETASRVRGRIESVLAWATVSGHREGDNPARWRGNLDAILPKPSRIAKVVHHPALSLDEVQDWYVELSERNGVASRALEFLALTAARSGEVRGAEWEEFNLGDMVWTIPAERMKAKKEHRVALTERTARIIAEQPRLQGSAFVFAAPRGGMLSDASIGACMKRIHQASSQKYLDPRSARPAVPHGLRSTFRDWAAERTDYPREMVEIALAHSVGSDVERAYRRTDMLERRRSMMFAWEAFLQDPKWIPNNSKTKGESHEQTTSSHI